MNQFFIGGVALLLALPITAVGAQGTASHSIDSLIDQGQRELTANWRAFGRLHNAAVFIHKDVKKSKNGRIMIWRHDELTFPEYLEKEKPYLSFRSRTMIDCKSSMVGIADSLYYAGRFGTGAVVAMNKRKDVDMSEAIPDSLEAQLVEVICKSTTARKPVHKAKPAKAAEDKPS